MKTVFRSVAVLSLLISTAFAQVAPDSVRRILPPPPPKTAGAGVGGGSEVDEAARFDLKFPGGTVKEFVTAVSKAVGRPVNVIIPKEAEGTMITAMEVSRVTVPGIFQAVSNASRRDVLVRTGSVVGGMNASFAAQTVGFSFSSEDAKGLADAVWVFQVKSATEYPANEPTAPPRTVQYYPVAEFLTHFSVEDITTAIESGWKLQAISAETPATIRFHEETKLLICAGSAAQIELIPQVLKGLAPMLRYPRSENLPITRKAGAIIVPKLDFREITPRAAVDFLRKKSAELDPEKQGFNIVLRQNDGVPEHKITLALNNVPALEALKYIATLSGLELEIEDHAIVLRERPLPTKPAFTPAPADAFPLPGFPAPATPPGPPSPPAP